MAGQITARNRTGGGGRRRGRTVWVALQDGRLDVVGVVPLGGTILHILCLGLVGRAGKQSGDTRMGMRAHGTGSIVLLRGRICQQTRWWGPV
jgi:hypothetical protein